MKIRTVIVGLAVTASTLLAAAPAYAHGCTLTASPPNPGGNTVSATSTYDCRPTAHDSGSKIHVWTCLLWQDVNGNLDGLCAYGWAWAGPNGDKYKTVTLNVGCPTVPTTYSTYAEGYIEHADGRPADHFKTASSPGVLVDPVTCAVLPRII